MQHSYTPLILGVLSFLVAGTTAFLTWSNAKRSNRTAEGHQQLQWTQAALSDALQAKEDASGARKEAREAREEAGAARGEAIAARDDLMAARRETQQMTTQMTDIMEWVDRVIRYAAEMKTDQLHDPKTIRLLAIINGGPPGMTNPRLRRPSGRIEG